MMPILKIGQKNFENRAKKTLKIGQKTLKIGPINFISDAVLVIYDPDLCSEVKEEKRPIKNQSPINRPKNIWIPN